MDNGLRLVEPKEYKVFLVEVDDEDRERVLSGLAGYVEINVEPQYETIHSYDSLFPVAPYKVSEDVTVVLKLRPRADGTYFVIENFMEEDDE